MIKLLFAFALLVPIVQPQTYLLNTLALFNPIENLLLSNTPREYSTNFDYSYDFIIIGAGSGGSVLANRLSANNNWTVLLLEAGAHETFMSDVPLLAPFQATTPLNWGYANEPQAGACLGLREQRCNAARGKALGGTSVINFLIYTRGNRADFDSWSTRVGDAAWSYDEVLPYFKRAEDCRRCHNADEEYHGYAGALKIENIRLRSPLLKRFLQAGHELGYGINDPNGRKHVGFSEAQATMNNGRRCSAAGAFLTPSVRDRANLQISTRSHVTKILTNPLTKTIIGVEFIKNRERFVVRARKEVLLAAGAFNSPQILMLSGIGPAAHLRSLGIKPIVDLKVGYNLQDHMSLSHLLFLVNQSITVSDRNVQNPRHVLNYLLNGAGPFTIPGGALGLAFLQTKDNPFGGDYPNVELVLGAGGLNGDTMGTLRGLLRLPEEVYRRVYAPVRNLPAFSIAPVMLRPRSVGRITLRSANPMDAPRIDANYLADERDVDVLVEGVKQAIAITKTAPFREIGTRLHDIPLPACAALHFATDAYWRCVIRQVAGSLGHPVGTCKMGSPTDADAVVDEQLKVRGVHGLRVVDASIMPHIVAGHTNSVVMMIGDKAADMIYDEWLARTP